MAIFQRILVLPVGMKVPPDYTIKGLGKSRGEKALVYFVPSRAGASDSQKRVRKSEWELVHQELNKTGRFTRRWFEMNLPDAAKDGTCSFRFIGEVFVLLGLTMRVDGSEGSQYILVP
jgi:hypothetical protein